MYTKLEKFVLALETIGITATEVDDGDGTTTVTVRRGSRYADFKFTEDGEFVDTIHCSGLLDYELKGREPYDDEI